MEIAREYVTRLTPPGKIPWSHGNLPRPVDHEKLFSSAEGPNSAGTLAPIKRK